MRCLCSSVLHGNIFSAVRLLPSQCKYGDWPRSGEICIFEGCGNENYTDTNGIQIGVQQVTSTLHFGPDPNQDGYQNLHISKNNPAGYENAFYKFDLIWNENGIQFFVNDNATGSISVSDGFWKRGRFYGDDIWSSGSTMAPFDQEVCTNNKVILEYVMKLFL